MNNSLLNLSNSLHNAVKEHFQLWDFENLDISLFNNSLHSNNNSIHGFNTSTNSLYLNTGRADIMDVSKTTGTLPPASSTSSSSGGNMSSCFSSSLTPAQGQGNAGNGTGRLAYSQFMELSPRAADLRP
jgi:hypothetical protein